MAVSLVPSSVELQVEAAHEVGISDSFSISSASETLKSQSSILVHPIDSIRDPNLMVVSPYEDEPHLLDLRTLDTPNRLLAKALTRMMCLKKDYATALYEESFNWAEVMDQLGTLTKEASYDWKEQGFYVVVFRSRVLPETIRADLGALDKAAHAEAMASGGFLKYWYGTPDENGRNLATCVWQSCYHARTATAGPHHDRAASAARRSYSEWRIQRLRLLIKDGVESWEISKWVD